MTTPIDARDVLDPNARTRLGFRGRVVGRFVATGPNPWDPFTYVGGTGPVIDVLPGVEVQLEPAGDGVRLRWRGEVVRIAWPPEEVVGTPSTSADARPTTAPPFPLAEYFAPFQNAPGLGAMAVIGRKLSDDGEPPIHDG